jgi:hypothetical protein
VLIHRNLTSVIHRCIGSSNSRSRVLQQRPKTIHITIHRLPASQEDIIGIRSSTTHTGIRCRWPRQDVALSKRQVSVHNMHRRRRPDIFRRRTRRLVQRHSVVRWIQIAPSLHRSIPSMLIANLHRYFLRPGHHLTLLDTLLFNSYHHFSVFSFIILYQC